MKSFTAGLPLWAIGFILAFFKLIYLFFDYYNILDFVVFLLAGIAFGGKVPASRWPVGLVMALPTFVLCLFIVLNLGYTSIREGVGTGYAWSLLVIPLATSIGIYIHVKYAARKRA